MAEPAQATPQPPSSEAAAANVSKSVEYIDRLKTRFAAQPEVYQQWLNIMKELHHNAIGMPEAIERVSQLLDGHPDLVADFSTFVPQEQRSFASGGSPLG